MLLIDPSQIAERLREYLDKPEEVAGWITAQAVMLKDGRLLCTQYLRTENGSLILRDALKLDVDDVLAGEKPHPESTDGLFVRFEAGERYKPKGVDTGLAVYAEMTLESEGLSYEC